MIVNALVGIVVCGIVVCDEPVMAVVDHLSRTGRQDWVSEKFGGRESALFSEDGKKAGREKAGDLTTCLQDMRRVHSGQAVVASRPVQPDSQVYRDGRCMLPYLGIVC